MPLSNQRKIQLLDKIYGDLQTALLNQMDNKPYILLDTFKLYIDIANKELKDLIKRVDLFCINFNEAIALSGQSGSDINEMSKAILDLGPKSLIIKDGKKGHTFLIQTINFQLRLILLKRLLIQREQEMLTLGVF